MIEKELEKVAEVVGKEKAVKKKTAKKKKKEVVKTFNELDLGKVFY